MDNPEDWVDMEGEGSEVFKDVEIGYDSNDPMLKALAGSDDSSLYTALVQYVYSQCFGIVKTPDSLKTVGIYLEEDRVKKITYKLTAMILETCDPVSGLNKLSLRDQGSTVCGRIFTRGEYLYSCKDCGVDPTCVMCPACFNASEHVNCRYRVSRSGGGGGTCDCGDVEAWKNHPTCRNHMKKEQVEVSESDKMLRIRIKRLFSQILRLAVELLYDNVCTTNCLSEKLRKIVENTDLSAVANTYSTNNECSLILYNDEVHSYDQVERMLKESVNATAEQAHIYATHIDKKGRTSLKTGARADCEEVFKIIRFDGKDKLPKIKLLVIDSNILELQEVTYRLLSWMNWLAGQGEIFRSAFCDAYLSSGFYPRRNSLEDTTTPFITHIMISDIHTWKAVRSIMMKNLLETMLKDPDNKMKVAEIFTDHYHKIYDNFFYKDDHDQQFSSSSISVQIFTTPTVVKELMHSHGLFEKIGKMTYDWYFPINEKSGMRELKTLTDRKPGNRAQCYPIDITYILHNPPSSDDENLRTVVKDGIFWLLEMFRLFEARDGVKWSHKNHVEHEPDWENLMTFIFSVQSTYTRLLQWAHRDEFVADYCISTILERYLQKTDDEFPPKSYDRNVLNEKFNFIPIDVLTKKVHIYNMYSRIFTHCISSPEISSRYNSHQIAYSCHKSLESLCVAAQSKAGFWKKNGQSHQFTMFYYSDQRCKRLLSNMDLQAAQLMVCHVDPDEFLATFIDGVGLNNAWLFNNDPEVAKASISTNAKFIVKDQYLKQMAKETTYMPSLLDEFLLVLIRIITEPFLETSTISKGQQIRRSLIHILALDYLPWSKIKKKLDHQYDSDVASQAEELLEELSQNKNVKGVRHYSLKPTIAKEWERYYIGYENAEQSKALEHMNHILKSEPKGLKDSIFIPKKNYDQRHPFDRVYGILDSNLFIKLTKLVFKLNDPLDSAVEKLGYLLALALLHGRGAWIKEQKVDEQLAEWGKENSGGKTTFPWLEWIQNQIGNSNDGETAAKESKSEWKKRAAASRAAMLAKMKQQQSSVMKNFTDIFGKSEEEILMQDDESMSEDGEFQVAPEITELFVDRDDKCSMAKINMVDDVWTCILCQSDTQVETESEDPLVMLGYFEESNVLDRYKTREGVLSDHELFLNSDWSRPLDAKCGTQLTTCGHVLHYSCFEKSLEMAKTNENRYAQLRTMREGNWKLTKEFTCMLCSRVCNTVLPLIDRETHKKLRFEPKRNKIEENKQPEPMKKDIKLFEWLSELQEEFGFAKKHKPQNYVINLGEIDMGQVDEAAETDGISAQDQNENSETGTRMLTRQAKKQRDSLIQTGNMEEDLNARVNNSFDSDGGDLKLDEESIGSSDSEDREFRLSKLKQVLYRHRDIHNKFEKNGKGHYVTSSYSISTSEVLLRYDRKPLMGSLPVRKDKALEFLVRSSLYLQQPFFGNMSFEEDDGVAATRQDARVLIKNLIADQRMTADVPAILTLDLFHAYFTLLLDLPYLDHLKPLQHQKLADKSFFRLFLAAQITQIAIYTSEVPEDHKPIVDAGEAQLFSELVNQLRDYRGLEPLKAAPASIYSHFIECLSPFIRKVSLLLMYLNLLQPPPELSDGKTSWNSMCLCLGIPTLLCELFDADGGALEPYAQRWIKQLIASEEKYELKSSLSDISFPQLIEIPSLAILPSDYRNVLTEVAKAECDARIEQNKKIAASGQSREPICTHIKNPAVCLFCNKVVCVLSNCCSEKIDKTLYGGGMRHAMKCGRGVGLFMLVAFADRNAWTDHVFQFCSGVKIILRDPDVVGIQSDILTRSDLFNSRKVKPIQCGLVNFDLPYVDSHGEPDRGLKSGAKLLLSSENYERIRREWLAHEISDSVSREIELGSNRIHFVSNSWYSF